MRRKSLVILAMIICLLSACNAKRSYHKFSGEDGLLVSEEKPVATKTYETTVKQLNIVPLTAPLKQGDIVSFGHYEQDGDSTSMEELLWDVVSVSDNKVLLFSHYVIDVMPFNGVKETTSWETCSLRVWLNDTFYNTCFDDKEKSKILVTEVPVYTNPCYATNPGNSTTDRLFLPDVNELIDNYAVDTWDDLEYIGYCEALMTVPTPVALEKGLTAEVIDDSFYERILHYQNFSTECIGMLACGYVLRTPGVQRNSTANYQYFGRFGWKYSQSVSSRDFGLRPMMYITLE